MSDEIKVKPTPIQRNILDVTMELTQMYYEDKSIKTITELSETFTKFHTLVCALEANNYRYFREYLPEDIKKIIEEK